MSNIQRNGFIWLCTATNIVSVYVAYRGYFAGILVSLAALGLSTYLCFGMRR